MKNTKTLFCAAPLPLLRIFTNWLAVIVFLLIIILLITLTIHFFRNKVKRKVSWGKMSQTIILWIGASILYLIIFSCLALPSLYHDFYPISLICLAIILFTVFYFARKFKLFKIRKIYTVITFILLIGSIVILGLKIKEFYFKPEIPQSNLQNLLNGEMPIGTIDDLSGCSGFSLY
jgi:hypothetical protein